MASSWLRFESLRWDDGPDRCPRCDEPGRCVPLPAGRRRADVRPVWRCNACRQQFSVLAGTVLEGTRVPLPVWAGAVGTLISGTAVSTRAFAREHSITPGTARHLIARLRAAGIAPGGADDTDTALRRLLRLSPEVVHRVRAGTPTRRGPRGTGPSAEYG